MFPNLLLIFLFWIFVVKGKLLRAGTSRSVCIYKVKFELKLFIYKSISRILYTVIYSWPCTDMVTPVAIMRVDIWYNIINRKDKELTKISFVLGILGSTCVWAFFLVFGWVLGYFISKSNCNKLVNFWPEFLGGEGVVIASYRDSICSWAPSCQRKRAFFMQLKIFFCQFTNNFRIGG